MSTAVDCEMKEMITSRCKVTANKQFKFMVTSQTNSIWQFIFYLAFVTFYFAFVI